MKVQFILLSLAIVAAGQALPANAQEGGNGSGGGAMEGGSRWIYKPNVWGAKKAPKVQPQAYIPHSVSAGSMPHSSAFLGVDPSMLKKPAPPPPTVQQQVQAIATVPHAQAAPFEKDFGAPVSEHIAQPKPMTESSMPAARSMSPSRAGSSNEVSGRLRHPVHSNAQNARSQSLPSVQTYGNQGYQPGVYDAGAGASTHTDATLVGRVLLPKRH